MCILYFMNTKVVCKGHKQQKKKKKIAADREFCLWLVMAQVSVEECVGQFF